jgi:hypothetical protein
MTIDEVLRQTMEWADATFPSATVESASEHMRREADELWLKPSDSEEMADVVMLVAHLAHMQGVDLAAAIASKLEKNRCRKWGKPDSQGVVEHVVE